MRLKVVKIGNSKGIRIPKALLDEYGIGETVEVSVAEEGVVLYPEKAEKGKNKKKKIPSWKIFRPLKIKGVSLSQALLDNRREERY
jgi:virulence-associated protein VagC